MSNQLRAWIPFLTVPAPGAGIGPDELSLLVGVYPFTTGDATLVAALAQVYLETLTPREAVALDAWEQTVPARQQLETPMEAAVRCLRTILVRLETVQSEAVDAAATSEHLSGYVSLLVGSLEALQLLVVARTVLEGALESVSRSQILPAEHQVAITRPATSLTELVVGLWRQATPVWQSSGWTVVEQQAVLEVLQRLEPRTAAAALEMTLGTDGGQTVLQEAVHGLRPQILTVLEALHVHAIPGAVPTDVVVQAVATECEALVEQLLGAVARAATAWEAWVLWEAIRVVVGRHPGMLWADQRARSQTAPPAPSRPGWADSPGSRGPRPPETTRTNPYRETPRVIPVARLPHDTLFDED